MAAAFRKFLRSSSAKLELGKSTDRDNMLQGSSSGTKQGDIIVASPKLQPERGGGGGGGGGGPTCRHLFAKACSTMQSYRDATKVCPAENVLLHNGKPAPSHHHVLQLNHNGVGGGGGSSKKAIKLGLNVGCGAAAAAAAGGGSTKSSKSKKGGGGGSGGSINESSMAHAKLVRTRRLMREFQDMCREQQRSSTRASIFTVELADDNLYEWYVKLHRVDPDSELYRDMKATSTPYILLNITFPENFPFAPPFMRVISPHIEKGFVMEGGAICMELLTPSGWASAYTVEAIIMQFSASLVKGQGRIAKKTKGGKDFNRKTAEASFRSLVKTHEKYGWVTPPLADG